MVEGRDHVVDVFRLEARDIRVSRQPCDAGPGLFRGAPQQLEYL